MATVRFQVAGLRQLGENMRVLNSKVAKRVCTRATSKAAQIIKRRAKATLKQNPSVQTGLLEKAVIIKKLGKKDSKLTSEHISAVKKVQYPDDPDTTRRVANFVEFGTVRMPAEPFMRPAFDTGKSEALTAMTDELRRGIDDATKGLPK